jgi:cobalamin biosynthesis protein CobT
MSLQPTIGDGVQEERAGAAGDTKKDGMQEGRADDTKKDGVQEERADVAGDTKKDGMQEERADSASATKKDGMQEERVDAASDTEKDEMQEAEETVNTSAENGPINHLYLKYEFLFDVFILSPIILVITGIFLLPTILYWLSSADQVRNQYWGGDKT